MTVEESLEKGENDFEGVWSGVPSSFTSIGLYSNAVQLHLPISLVAEEFKVAKCRRVMTLHDLLEQWLGNTGVQTRSGRKWFTMWEGDQAESLLVFRDIIGNTCTSTKGFECHTFSFGQWLTSRRIGVWCKERWKERSKKSEDHGQQKSASRESEYDGTMQQFAVGAVEGPIQDFVSFSIRRVYDSRIL